MKKLFTQLRLTALTGLALSASIGVSQATTYNQNFNNTGNSSTNFSGAGTSVASWITWYNTPGGSAPMFANISDDQGGHQGTNGVGPGGGGACLDVSNPFGTAGTQNVFFGTFDNAYGYDFSTRLDFTAASQIFYYIKMAPGSQPRTNNAGLPLDFGSLGVGIINGNYGYQQFGGNTPISTNASNAWVQMSVTVDQTQNNLSTVPGITFAYQSYGGFPHFSNEFYIDSIVVTAGAPPPPPIIKPLVAAVPGLNIITATPSPNGQYSRYQICSQASTGYTFVGQPDVTYSWTASHFPLGLGNGGWQEHFFLVGNYATGQYDTAADYNLPDVFWVTIGQNDVLTTNPADGKVTVSAGTAFANFRMKTNEPGGNGMLFNTVSPTDVVNNPNGWPIEPIANMADPSGAAGTWKVEIVGSTSITITHVDSGLSTNFSITPAQAAIFADPLSICLGGQPNVTTAGGDYMVYENFSASGFANPAINENFVTEGTLNTATWKSLAADTNGTFVVPQTAAYWVPWTLPDVGFILQDKANLNVAGSWTMPTTPIQRINGNDQALLMTSQLPSPGQGYFQLLQYQFSQLQVLPAAEVNSPGGSGHTGSVTPVSLTTDSGVVNVTINAVDAGFHIVSGITDVVHVTESSGSGTTPNDAALVNGTLTTAVIETTTGSYTIMAADTSNPLITTGTSDPVTINP